MSCALPEVAASAERLAQARKAVNWEVHAMNGNTSSSASVVSESTFDGHVGPVVLPVHLPGLNLGRGS